MQLRNVVEANEDVGGLCIYRRFFGEILVSWFRIFSHRFLFSDNIMVSPAMARS